MAALPLSDDVSLGAARELTRRGMERGVQCPCCDQHVRTYRRPLNHVPGAVLVVMAREVGRNWVHIPTLMSRCLPQLAGQGGYAVLSQHWGLIEEENAVREDGGRAGCWRLTNAGVAFAGGLIVVHKFARIYNGNCLGLEGPTISIQQALGTRFDYGELIRG